MNIKWLTLFTQRFGTNLFKFVTCSTDFPVRGAMVPTLEWRGRVCGEMPLDAGLGGKSFLRWGDASLRDRIGVFDQGHQVARRIILQVLGEFFKGHEFAAGQHFFQVHAAFEKPISNRLTSHALG